MKREFLIEEIMLPGVSGEVRGWIEIDADSGSVDHLECTVFRFRDETKDQEIGLSDDQRRVAIEIAERTMAAQLHLWAHRSTITASAEPFSPVTEAHASQKVLAEFLASPRTNIAADQTPQQPQPATRRRRAQ